MTAEKKIGKTTVRVIKDDITLIPVDAFVFYAQPDLHLGSGYGNAIAVRGGPKVQEELKEIGSAAVTEVVVTSAGKLKAKHILHAVGPSFQEADNEAKLITTTRNALKKAEELGAESLALPAMGAGFYGVPLADCARITLTAAREYLANGAKIKEVVFCLNDNREVRSFTAALDAL